LDSFHTADTADVRTFIGDMTNESSYPLTSYEGVPIAPAKLLNVSNTNGGSDAKLVRQFDKFVEENGLVACTAVSSLRDGNWTTSGMAYNSIVVDQSHPNPNNYDGAKLNDHGSPRYKPDIAARTARGAAVSYSAPQVCSAAAMLLERSKVDPRLANAYNSIAIKSILMAGATRFNYKASADWSDVSPTEPLFTDGEWERASDALPQSFKYGAGALNVLAAYDILEAGEFDADADGLVHSRGWDFARDLIEGEVTSYRFAIEGKSMFSAVLVWHRYVDDAWASYLPDYELSVYGEGGTRVAHSNSETSNVELLEVTLQPGGYDLKVRLASADSSPGELAYGLAWTTKAVCPDPSGLRVAGDADSWNIEWEPASVPQCHKYRLQVRSGDEDSEDVEKEVYLDVNAYSYPKPDEASTRYFRVSTYPEDGGVAYRYPSSPSRIVGDP